MSYQDIIREVVPGDVQPRHIEGWLRLEHGCLDALSRGELEREARWYVPVVRADPIGSEQLARTEGL